MTPRRTGPLRAVVGRVPREIAGGARVVVERLECGHEQRPRQDAFGPTHAIRRRCRRCRADPKPVAKRPEFAVRTCTACRGAFKPPPENPESPVCRACREQPMGARP